MVWRESLDGRYLRLLILGRLTVGDKLGFAECAGVFPEEGSRYSLLIAPFPLGEITHESPLLLRGCRHDRSFLSHCRHFVKYSSAI